MGRPVFIERTSRHERIVQGSVGTARVERDGSAMPLGLPLGSLFLVPSEFARKPSPADPRLVSSANAESPAPTTVCPYRHDAPMSFILPETEPDQGAGGGIDLAGVLRPRRVQLRTAAASAGDESPADLYARSPRLCLPRIPFFLKTLTLPPSADRVRRCDPSLSRCS